MADNLFLPFHRSYRLTLTMAALLGGFIILSYTLWHDLQVCRQEAQQCSAKADQLERLVSPLQREKAALQEKMQGVLLEHNILQEQVASLENTITDLTGELRKALEEKAANQTRIQELEGELAGAQLNLDTIKTERQQLAATIRRLENQIARQIILTNAATWLSRHWQVSSALLFAGIAAPAALLNRKARKSLPGGEKRQHCRRNNAGSIWMLVSRSEAKAVSKLRRRG